MPYEDIDLEEVFVIGSIVLALSVIAMIISIIYALKTTSSSNYCSKTKNC